MEAAAFDFAPAIPEIFLACAAMGLLMVGVFRTEPEASHLVWPLAVMALVVALFLLLVDDTDPAVTFGGQFVTDRFAVYLKVLILIGAGLCLMMSPGFMAREGIERFEYPVLALFTTVGMMMMISANSLLALYIGARAAQPAALRDDRVPSRPDPLDRGRPQVFRARRARLGAAALWLQPGLRLHRHALVRGAWRRASAPPAKVQGSAPAC